jgi:hypothetical protein
MLLHCLVGKKKKMEWRKIRKPINDFKLNFNPCSLLILRVFLSLHILSFQPNGPNEFKSLNKWSWVWSLTYEKEKLDGRIHLKNLRVKIEQIGLPKLGYNNLAYSAPSQVWYFSYLLFAPPSFSRVPFKIIKIPLPQLNLQTEFATQLANTLINENFKILDYPLLK